MPRPVRPCLVLLAAVIVVASSAALPGAVAREGQGASLHVLGARVHPLKPKGKAWDADHRQIPLLVYRPIGGRTGFPPIPILSMVPYRNRPDPYVVVLAKEVELGRSKAVQGTFLPTWVLEVPLPPNDKLPPVLTLEVFDDDLQDDDQIGKAIVDTQTLVSRPGLHVLEGSGGLHDLTVVVRNPAAEGAGPTLGLRIQRSRCGRATSARPGATGTPAATRSGAACPRSPSPRSSRAWR